MTAAILLAIIFLGNLLFSILLLWLGARWVKAPKAFFLRACLAMLLMFAFGLLLTIVEAGIEETVQPGEGIGRLAVLAPFLIVQIVVGCVVIKSSFQTTLPRAIVVWALGLLGGIPGVAFLLGIMPNFLEAVIVPTNSMAPSIMGWHETSVCPQCQGRLIIPSHDKPRHPALSGDQLGICASCVRASRARSQGSSVAAPDRIIVNKLLEPQRWDIIVFRGPEFRYAMRLVGLPGEMVYVKDGAVWVNHVRLEEPPEIAGLRYAPADDAEGFAKFGTHDNPWRLGPDEYCVLGDFAEQSYDSRFWGPVPGSNIEGVVSLCYWPVSRWRIFR